MLEFIQLLNQRYQAIFAALKSNDSTRGLYQQRIEQLIFAEAFIRKGQLIDSTPDMPLQIAVIGPTQAGKSSVVNLILNSASAGVSPLAGYTVHPHGFCHQVNKQQCTGLQHYFGRFQQLIPEQLTAERYDCYALADSVSNTALLPECVFWDTPDFDSIDSVDYREGVIRTIALADIVVLVVSKEKYADQSVWEMMAMLESFQQPTLICINKLIEDSESIIINSLKEKWAHARTDVFPDVVPLYYQKQTAMPNWPEKADRHFFSLQRHVSHDKHFLEQQRLINNYWEEWLEPIIAEQEAARHWCLLVDDVIKQSLDEYQRDYLNHPHYYDTFQNALIELLNLLEIPGISKVLTKTRRVLTWPIRKVMRIGRRKTLVLSHEEAILKQVSEHLLIVLADKLLEKIDSDTKQHKWWKDSYCLLRDRKTGLLVEYEQNITQYVFSFQQDVDQTANRLYNKLSEQPLLLNSLRATRVTTDAAAMALIIQTGGIGLYDLVITPAMLSLTSLLTESAIGGYMRTVEAELKQHQLKTVNKDVFIACIQQSLYALPAQMSDKGRFNISAELLVQANKQRNEKKYGIRLL